MESLRETLRSGRKRARESPWERAKNWSPTPIGVVPGASLEKLALGARGVRVSSGVVAARRIERLRVDVDARRIERLRVDVDDRADDHLDADDSADLDLDDGVDVSAAVNVGGARVELSESQRASVAASVACLL